jgi:POT family proton-dependent oligopeptide transporter
MLLGLLVFVRGRHWFDGKADPVDPVLLQHKLLPGISVETLIYLLSLLGVVVCWQLMQHQAVVGGLLSLTLVIMTAIVIAYAVLRCEPQDRDRMLVCLFLMSYQIVFWALFEQAGSSLNLMTERNFDRQVMGLDVPAATFQSANAFFIFLLAPLFNIGWIQLARRGWEPSVPTKFSLALIQVGLGFLCLVFGAGLAADPTQIALVWLLLLYLLHTTGELCISPIGLSMTTKLSAPKVVGMMMGCWFLASAAGNYVSGMIAAMTGSAAIGGDVADPVTALSAYLNVYTTAGWISIGMGIAALLLAPLLKKYMHGIQ